MHKTVGVFIPKDYTMNIDDYIESAMLMDENEDNWENYTLDDLITADMNFIQPCDVDNLILNGIWYKDRADFAELLQNYHDYDIALLNVHCVYEF